MKRPFLLVMKCAACGLLASSLHAQIQSGSTVILSTETPLVYKGQQIRMGQTGEQFQVLGVNKVTKTVIVSTTTGNGTKIAVALRESDLIPIDQVETASNPAETPPSLPKEGELLTALELASAFRQNVTQARNLYSTQHLTVEGVVERFDNFTSPAGGTALLLATANGLPRVRVTILPQISEDNEFLRSIGWPSLGNWFAIGYRPEFRVENDILKARLVYKHRYRNSGEWLPLLSKGQTVVVVGTCTGLLMDVQLENCRLIPRK